MEDLVAHPDPAFWAGKRVLITGHTGFKGAWLVRMLAVLGARVSGLARDPLPGPSAFATLAVAQILTADHRTDLADRKALEKAIADQDLVIHLAAQAILSDGMRNPAGTWASNVTGTLHLLEVLRGTGIPAVIVTSDKVYRNAGDGRRSFSEDDPLGGSDPYSATKAACEILVTSHHASFADLPPLATARAGNVIGGGDFGRDRLIPDLVRAIMDGAPLSLRNPQSSRPFLHVLDVLAGYLLLAEALSKGSSLAAVNFGPDQGGFPVIDLLTLWSEIDSRADWFHAPAPSIPEKPHLALDSSLARRALGWQPRLTIRQAVASTASWYRGWLDNADMTTHSVTEIQDFLGV